MKKAMITISYDEEKLSAVKLYLEQKGMQVEDELTKALETLYTKNVPAGVREFFELRFGAASLPQKAKKQKLTLSSAVEIDSQEVKANE